MKKKMREIFGIKISRGVEEYQWASQFSVNPGSYDLRSGRSV
jgi:hypothetical protein